MADITTNDGPHGLHDMMREGPSHALKGVTYGHPLEQSEKNFFQNAEKRELTSARNMQGMHMTMKLQMERSIASKIQRLPGLPSSHLALRTLMGANDSVGPEDIFNDISENIVDYRALGDRKMGL